MRQLPKDVKNHRTIIPLMREILDTLFHGGLVMNWNLLRETIVRGVRSPPHSHIEYVIAFTWLENLGWVRSTVPWADTTLTTSAWLMLSLERYPWPAELESPRHTGVGEFV